MRKRRDALLFPLFCLFVVCCLFFVSCVFSFFSRGFFSNQEGTLAGASPREKKSGRFFVEKGKPFDQRFFFGFFFHLGAGDLAQGLMMRLFCF